MCLLLGSHDRAVLLYEYVGKKTVDLQHTEVPDAYRGRGIAKHLAKVSFLNPGVAGFFHETMFR